MKTYETGKIKRCKVWSLKTGVLLKSPIAKGPYSLFSCFFFTDIPHSFSNTLFWTVKPWLSFPDVASSSWAGFGTNSVPIRDRLGRSLPLFGWQSLPRGFLTEFTDNPLSCHGLLSSGNWTSREQDCVSVFLLQNFLWNSGVQLAHLIRKSARTHSLTLILISRTTPSFSKLFGIN